MHHGIPGTIGGAVRMNAGAYGSEIGNYITQTTYINKELEICTVSNKENNFGYRTSRFVKNKDEIIIEITLELKDGIREEIKAKMEEYKTLRKDKQPLNFPNAGSTFKRGNDYITAELIDKCGLKGYNIGDAYVSEKHAGFIVNKGKATSKDVIELINIVKQNVYKKFGVNIELEIEVLGED